MVDHEVNQNTNKMNVKVKKKIKNSTITGCDLHTKLNIKKVHADNKIMRKNEADSTNFHGETSCGCSCSKKGKSVTQEIPRKAHKRTPSYFTDDEAKPRVGAQHVMLVGNPNCGKSTVFNKYCNQSVRTGNYPGVTVERHVGNYSQDIQILDIPGIYSLTSATDEERIATYELLEQEAELIVNIVDACSLERGLYLTYELLLLGKPVIMLLNMWDGLKARGISIDVEALSQHLGIKIIPFSAVTGLGDKEFRAILDNLDFASKLASCREEPEILAILYKLSQHVPAAFAEHGMFWAKAALVNEECPSALIEDPKFSIALKEAAIELQKLEPGVENYQILAEARYKQIEEALTAVHTKTKGDGVSHSIDYIFLNRYLSIPLFFLVMGLVYYASITSLGGFITDWINDTLFGEMLIPSSKQWLGAIDAPTWVVGLVSDGIITGVGAVLGFVPQMMILFLLLSLLEECGYMTRAAFILDRFFNLLGLSGRAFIPYLIGTGCGVPALMTARTLGTESERRIVLFTTTMIPCGAKLPVIIVFASAVFADVPFFAPGMYMLSVLVIICAALILGKFKDFRSAANPMLLELPTYHIPSLKVVTRTVWQRSRSFIIKAGTVILASVVVIWASSSFTFRQEDKFIAMIDSGEDADISILADVARPVQFVFEPMGFESYKPVVSTVAGLIAKENIVSSLAVLSGAKSEEDEDFGDRLLSIFHGDKAAAFAFIIFNLFTLPCFACIGVLRRELNDKKFFFKAIGFILGFSYMLAVASYQLWHLYLEPSNIMSFGGMLGIVIVCVFGYLLLIKRAPKTSEKIDFLMIK